MVRDMQMAAETSRKDVAAGTAQRQDGACQVLITRWRFLSSESTAYGRRTMARVITNQYALGHS